MSTAISPVPSPLNTALIVRWVIASLIGWIAGLYLCDIVKEVVYSFTHFNIDGVIIGTCIGLAQTVALWGYVQYGFVWFALSIVGYGFGKGFADAYGGLAFPKAALGGALIGVCVGLAQVLILRDNVRRAWAWPLVNIIAWSVGWSIIAPATAGERMHPVDAYVVSSIGAVAFAAITGAFLAFFHHDTPPTEFDSGSLA